MIQMQVANSNTKILDLIQNLYVLNSKRMERCG
jgi:hypothetical protein